MAHRQVIELRRVLGAEIRRLREDAGISQRQLARAAGISHALLVDIEAGEVSASLEALARICAGLGGKLGARVEVSAGPAIRDHIQAAMLQGLTRAIHPRWRRFVDVPVFRPVRGSIDLVLDDPVQEVAIAGEAQSELRRIEQQVRWANVKAEALRDGGNRELAMAMGADRSVSRLLLVRSTAATRKVAMTYPDLLSAAYPAMHASAVATLTGTADWPGPSLVWMDVGNGIGVLRTAPPRGVPFGR